MKIFVTLFLFLLFSVQCFSQTHFKKGYYVNNAKDTIQGLIKDFDWKYNPNNIIFKSNKSASEEKLEPNEVLYFEIYDKVKYKSARVDIDVSDHRLSELNEERLPEFENKHLFLKVLDEGEVNLYKYHVSTYKRFFIKKEDGALKQMIHKRYLDNNGGIRENNNFRQQLLNDLKCDNLSKSQFSNLEYNETSLRKLISKYNSCHNNKTYTYKKKERDQSIFLSIRPGAQLASLTTELNGKTNTEFDTELNIRMGIELEIVLPFNNSKWAVIFEPTFQKYASTKEVESIIDGRYREVDYSSIEFPLGARYYMFLNDQNKLFLNAGYVYDHSFDSQIDGNVGIPLDIQSDMNPFFGIGYRFKERFSFEFRYQTSRDIISEYMIWRSNYSSYAFILGYTIL